jgi:hypothetical protein
LNRTDFSAELVRDRVSGALGRGKLACVPNEYAFDAFFRSTLQVILVEDGKVFMHAAALLGKMAGRRCAYLLPGRSGMGKSTIAAKFGDESALSDELPCLGVPPRLLRRSAKTQHGCKAAANETMPHTAPMPDRSAQAGPHSDPYGVVVYGTPFHGRFSSQGHNLSVPLAGIFFLERKLGPHAVALNKPEALMRLMTLIACYERYEPVSEAMLLIGRAAIAALPSFVFGFDRSESAGDISARLAAAVNRPGRGGGK